MSEPQAPSPQVPGPSSKSMDDIMALCKRRGFIYQASEIYGGINGFWDYGPLGAQMKKNLRDAWWEDMIMRPCWGRKGPKGAEVLCVPVETCIIQHPRVWEASGHVAGFNDPMVDDKETKQRFRADHLHGVFDHGGGTGDPDEFVQQLLREYTEFAREFQPRTLPHNWKTTPSRTIIANNEQEALVNLESDKRLQKQLGIRVLKTYFGTEDPKAIVVYDKGPMGCQVALVRPVPQAMMKDVPERIPSPYTNKTGTLTEPKQFNLMFFSYTGAVFNEDNKVYLRPETAQGIFVQFKNVVDTTRIRVPFGIGNTGKSFRNEITPRNYTFRSREFEQAELEFFCHPDESPEWYAFWREFRMDWWKALGLAGENLRLREHEKDELSHYSQGTCDVEYRFPFTAPEFGELEGVAHRGNYDLTQHQKHSGVKLEYFDTTRGEPAANGQPKGERYLPHCIEPAAGLDRGVLALLCEAYTKDPSRASPEFMKFHPRIAPIKAAVFPLVNKDGMPEVAEKLHADLVKRFGRTGLIETDAKQSIGKRYARMDEAGCPYCFTIDGDTLKDQTVTVRNRDTGGQERIGLDRVVGYLDERLVL